jgi:hypothetical protein
MSDRVQSSHLKEIARAAAASACWSIVRRLSSLCACRRVAVRGLDQRNELRVRVGIGRRRRNLFEPVGEQAPVGEAVYYVQLG